MSETDSLSEARPVEIVRWGQKSHCAIPETPPSLNFSIALWIVPTGGGAHGACGNSNSGHQFREEFRRIIRMDDIRSAASKVNSVQQFRYEGLGLAIQERDDGHHFGEAINDGQGFDFAR